MSDRQPPLAQDLAGVRVPYSWKFGAAHAASPPGPGAADAEACEAERLRRQVQHLTAALEDIVALALASADYKERAIMMHRRAVAALSRPPAEAPRS